MKELRERTVEFQRRRDVIVERLRSIPGFRCEVPEGSFYAFPNVSGRFRAGAGDPKLESGGDLAAYLLEKARVAVVPGEAFGSAEHVRISYAVSVERMSASVSR